MYSKILFFFYKNYWNEILNSEYIFQLIDFYFYKMYRIFFFFYKKSKK
jgi:hypothetical protein